MNLHSAPKTVREVMYCYHGYYGERSPRETLFIVLSTAAEGSGGTHLVHQHHDDGQLRQHLERQRAPRDDGVLGEKA